MSAIISNCFQTLYRNPGPDPPTSNTGQEKTSLTGRILEQYQTHTGGTAC